jgi:hypothetical protein
VDAPIPPGWIGGFEQSNPAFAYPTPDLSSLKMLDNLANIDLLERQQAVKWPEFSWLTVPGKEDSRCFQRFATYISRLGYTNTGRVYSIICPQQGACSPNLGCFNVEVTVTGQRGWANETNREFAADMTVEGKIWFSPSTTETNWLVNLFWEHFENSGYPFPADKAHAIRVSTHLRGHPEQPIFPLRIGEADLFEAPGFARHPEAWTVGNIEVEIGPIAKTGVAMVDEFNALVMTAFNIATGNMLAAGNLLTWNVWFVEPALVDQEEWRTHAQRWRDSIDADHGSPGGDGTPARYFNGDPFSVERTLLDEEVQAILKYLEKHVFESSMNVHPDARTSLRPAAA